MTVPNFLVIGAMKAGTTTLYRDLYQHPAIYMPECKEPNDLASDDVLTVKGRRRYEALFQGCRGDQIAGEASTAYTKRPRYLNVAERALEVLGPNARMVYLVRDPFSRAVSHYQHDFGQGKASADVDRELLREGGGYLDYSRYAYQLKPWVQLFGPSQILLVRFENYVENRNEFLGYICDFLGVDRIQGCAPEDRSFNASRGKALVRSRALALIRDSRTYQTKIKPLISWKSREKIRQLVLRKAPLVLPKPTENTKHEFMRMIGEEEFDYQSLGLSIVERQDVVR